ncbi:MAG: hypothetical protein U0325_20805 [Polyangiales bacterium]
MTSDPPPPPRGSALPPWLPGVLGGLLAISLLVNGLQLARGPRVVERTRTVTVAAPPPMQPECPAAPACPEPAPCPGLPDAGAPVLAARTNGAARPPRPPPVDEAMAAQGEGDINRAAETGERDPVQVAAQRTVANGVDRIVNSRSPAAVRRFFQRTLPSFASMECAFRDPASAEHVRMQLRPMNALLPVAERMSEADLTRYERELRCPRE